MNNGEYKKAHNRLKILYDALKKPYPNDFEYIGRDVVTALVECDKRGNTGNELEKHEKDGVGIFSTIGGTSLQLSSLSVKAK